MAVTSKKAVFAGDLSAAGGTFKGSLSAATGTFAGELKAATGTFEGSITSNSATITGGSITIDSGTYGYSTISSDGIYSQSKEYSASGYKQSTYLTYHGIRTAFKNASGGGVDATILHVDNPDSTLSMPWGTGIWLGLATGKNNRLLGYWDIQEVSTSTAVTSDKTKKNSIAEIGGIYDALFDRLLPVVYKYNEGTSDRVHTGFIAQDVEDAVLSVGLTTKELAGVCYSLDENGVKYDYKIRYDEFVAINTWQIQKLKVRVAELEAIVAKLQDG